METAAKPPVSLYLVVALLLAAGGVVMYGLRGLRSAPPPIQAQGAPAARPQPSDPAATLRAAIDANDAPALRALRDKGVDLNAQYQFLDSSRRALTPLTYAAIRGAPDMVRALLAAGAKPDAVSEGGLTPLMMAAARGDAATVDTLIQAGAPVDAQDKWGATALMGAAHSGSVAKVRLLLAAGASFQICDDEGNSALIMAAGQGGTPESLHALLDADADPNKANKAGITPLMRAAEAGDRAKCMDLLDFGARVDLKDSQGRTAADWAAMRPDATGSGCASLLAGAGG